MILFKYRFAGSGYYDYGYIVAKDLPTALAYLGVPVVYIEELGKVTVAS